MNEKIKVLDTKPGKGGNHTVINGDISEAIFILIARKKGWNIAVPFGNPKAWDFIARINNCWCSIQVKTVYIDKQGDGKRIRCVGTRKGLGKNYNENEFDYLFAASEDDCWLIPWEKMKNNKSSISLDSTKWNEFLL